MKEQLIELKDSLFGSLETFGTSMLDGLLNFLVALLLLLFGWIVSKIISKIILKVLTKANVDALAEKLKLHELTGGSGMDIKLSKIASKIVFWFLFMIFFITAVDKVGWTVITEEIKALITFIPKLIVAGIIFTLGFYLATLVRDVLTAATKSLGIGTGRIIANLIFYFLVIIIALTSLQQTGIDTSIITSNLNLIIGAVLIAGAIAYGFGAKDIMSNVLSTFFAKKSFKAGQVVQVGAVKGTIIEIDSISIKLDTGSNHVVIPTQKFLSDNVIILQDIE